ncbi:hypothetical protein B0I32_10581 [Nonomuraea fuscirosea]|uniref:Uncharacterized protein n=1 Tax=Nonomuraea fuscirosea TaxID=1291556 RepID=A0A2T0N384_9ACTN|nr:hypothetical protein B0I32_10581 [Nonomuraea fuscirosea]
MILGPLNPHRRKAPQPPHAPATHYSTPAHSTTALSPPQTMARSPLCRSHSPQSPSSEHHGRSAFSHRTTVPQPARGSPSPAPRHPSPQHPLSRPPQDGHSPTFRPPATHSHRSTFIDMQPHVFTRHRHAASSSASGAYATPPSAPWCRHRPRPLHHGHMPPSPSIWAMDAHRPGRTSWSGARGQLSVPPWAKMPIRRRNLEKGHPACRPGRAARHAIRGKPPSVPPEQGGLACRPGRAARRAVPAKAGWHAP